MRRQILNVMEVIPKARGLAVSPRTPAWVRRNDDPPESFRIGGVPSRPIVVVASLVPLAIDLCK
ncbi:MAG: hypothetical protein M3552_21870, partial [Planctomycetota bacterium]|nr:hypothetical protein [Planctomycetota bacterium]